MLVTELTFQPLMSELNLTQFRNIAYILVIPVNGISEAMVTKPRSPAKYVPSLFPKLN